MPGAEKVPPSQTFILNYDTLCKVKKNMIHHILNKKGQNSMQGRILAHSIAAGSHKI
jgi:hypothetical protein